MQIKIILTVLQCLAETRCCVSWQHECFRLLLSVMQIISAVAKLFLHCCNNSPWSKSIKKFKKMGVV